MKHILLSLLLILPVMAGEPSPKALKYHEILQKRPSSGYVFDRFYDTWLDSATSAELETFLTKKSTEGKPNDQLLLAYYHLRQGQEIKALKLYQTALKASPGNATIGLQKAKLEARLLNFDGALKDLKAALPKATDEQKLTIQNLRGRYLARSGQPAEAAKLWKSLLAAQPNNADLIASILEIQISEGLFDEALATSALQIKATRDPYQKVIHTLRRGDIFQRAGKRKKAIDTYVSTLDAVGQNSWLEREILAQLREIHRREDDMEGLNKLYTDLTTKHPQRIGIQKAQAHLLATLGRNEDAVALFRNVLKITPGNRKNQEELIAILLKTNNLKDALKEIQRLAKANPKDANIQLKLASVLHKAKEQKSIPEALHRYQSLKDNSEVSRLLIASLFTKYELPAEAEKSLRSAVKAYPESMESIGALAQLLNTLDKKDEATAIWKNMIAKGKRETVIRQTTQLKQSGKEKLAYKLLKSRSSDFSTDLPFLNHLTRSAIEQKDFKNASTWAMNILKLSKHTEEIRQAVKLNAQTALKSELEAELTQSLAKKKDRTTVESWLLAELYELQGQSELAVKTLEALRKQDERIAAIAEVALYEYRGDWVNAAAATQRMIALPKGKKPINLRRLVDFYDRLDQIQKSLKYIEIWKQTAPGDKSPWFKQADLLSATGKLDEAIQTLRRAAQRFDNDNDFRAKLAGLYQTNDQPAHAERLYWRLYEEANSLSERLRWVPQLAEVAEAQGRGKDLLARFLEKRKNNRKSVEPLLALAEIYRFNESYEERRKFMMEAARLRPNDPDILFAIANIEEREGDTLRAEATLQQAAEVDKSDKTKRAIAQFYLRNDEVEKGTRLMKELSGGKSASPRDLEKAAISIAVSGDMEVAAQFVKKALTANPDDYRLAFLRSIFLAQEERYSDSLTQLLAALKMNKPLQGVTPINTQKKWKEQFQQSGALLPKTQMYLLYDNYAARLFKKSNRRNRNPRGQNASYSLPGDLYEKQPLIHGAIMHVLSKMDEEERTRVLPIVTAAGIKDIDFRTLLVAALQNSGETGIQKIKEYAKANPTRTEAFYYPVMSECMQIMWSKMYGYGGNKKTDVEFLTLARDKAKGLTPSILFSIEMTLLMNKGGESTPADWKRALAQAAKIEKKEEIASASGYLAIGMEKTQGLPAEIQAAIHKQATTWYWSGSANPTQYRSFFTSSFLGRMILFHASQKKDSAAFLAFLEKACEVHSQQKKPANTNFALGVNFRGRNQKKQYDLPVFPPKNTTLVPQLVIGVFADKDKNSAQSGRKQMGADLDLEALALDELLDTVKNPYLRIHIARHYGAKDALESSLKTITSADHPTLQSTYYMAGYLAQQDKFAEASALLSKARFLPMKRIQRKQLDEQITALALAIYSADGEKKNPEAILQGRRAALRLRRSVSGNERLVLIAALDDLGLQKEADLVAAKSSRTPLRSSSSQNNQSNKSELEKIKKAIDSGNREKAERLVLRSIKQQLSQQQGWRTVRNAKGIRELVKKQKFLAFLKKKMHPGESTSLRRRANYGLLLHLFGEDKEALPFLDNAAKKGLKDNNVFLTLAFMLPPSRKDDATTYLDKYVIRNPQRYNNALNNKFDEFEEISITAWLNAYELLANYMETRPVERKKNTPSLEWVKQAASDLVGSNYVKSISFPSLGASNLTEKNKKDAKGYYKRRLQIARKLLKASLRQPDLAAWAFPIYHGSFLALKEEGKLDPKLAMLALKNSLIGIAEQKNNRPGSAGGGMMSGFNSSGKQAKSQTPLNFIATQAWKNKTQKIFTKAYLDELRKHDKESSHPLEVLQSVLFLSDDQLESSIAKQLKKQTPKNHLQLTAYVLTDVCLVRNHRSPAIETWMTQKPPMDSITHWQKHMKALTSAVPQYALLLLEKDPSRIAPFLKEVATAIIQPEGDIVEFVKKATSNSYSADPSDKNFRLRSAKTLLQSIGRSSSPLMSLHTMRCMLSVGLGEDSSFSNLTYQVTNKRFKSLDEALLFFKRAGFGKMQTSSELVKLSQGRRGNLFVSLLASLSSHMRDSKSSKDYISIQEVEKRLSSPKPEQPLILRLAMILQTSKNVDRKKYLSDILITHKHPITDWDKNMAEWFAEKIIKPSLQNKKTKVIDIPKSYPKSARAQLDYFLKSYKKTVSKKLDSIIAIKKFKDAQEYQNTRNFLTTHFKTYFAQDRAKLIKALGNTASLARLSQIEKVKKSKYYNPFLGNSGRGDYGRAYEIVRNNFPHEKCGGMISFIHAVYQAESTQAPVLPLSAIESGSRELSHFHGDLINSNKKPAVHIKELTQLISEYEKLPKSEQPLAALTVVYFLCNDSRLDMASLDRQLKHFEALNKKKPSLIKTAACAGISSNLVDWMDMAWGSRAAAHTRKLYEALPKASQRILLTHILEKEGGEIFCDDTIQALATQAISEKIKAMSGHERINAYRSLHNITFQKASTQNQKIYLDLFNQLKADLRKATLSTGGYSSSSSRDKKFSEKTNFSKPEQALLGLALRSGDEAALRHVMLRHKAKIIGNPYAVCLALRYNKPKIAQTLWRGTRYQVDSYKKSYTVPTPMNSPLGLMDNQLEKSLAAFIKLNPNDKDRLLLRDTYLIRTTSFAPGFTPKQDFWSRCDTLINKNLPDAKYGIESSLDYFDILNTLMKEDRFDEKKKKEIEGMLMTLVPRYMEELLKLKSYNLNKNWNSNEYPIVSLYFKKLAMDDNLEEFNRVYNKMISTETAASRNGRTVSPLLGTCEYLQTKVFDAINAGDREKLLHYRKYLDTLATASVTYYYYNIGKKYTLSVALHALCYAYSENPAEYQDFVKKLIKIDARVKDRTLLDGFYPFSTLMHATYKGKPFVDKANEGFQLKVLNQIIRASHEGMFSVDFVYNVSNRAHYKFLVKQNVITKAVSEKLNKFDKKNRVLIAKCSPEVIGNTSKNPKYLTVDITQHITANGSYPFSLSYIKGKGSLNVDSMEVLRDGKSIWKSEHKEWTTPAFNSNSYVLKVTDYKAGQKYTIKIKVYGDKSNNVHGEIILRKMK